MTYIFDFDDTIVNSMDTHILCYKKAFKHISPYCCNKEIDIVLKENLSKGIEEVCRILDFDKKDISHLKKMKDMYFDVCKLKIPLNKFSFNYIHDKRVKNKYIISNARSKTIIDLLKFHKIENNFKKIVSREKFNNYKPHPEMGLYLIKEENLDPRSCVYFGDSDIDKEFSENCGFFFKKVEVK